MPVKNVNVARRRDEFDAIVVGSGITGGYAAKELCEKGLKVLVLERGRPLEHGRDYITEHTKSWEMEHRGRGFPERYARDFPVQSRTYAFGEATEHFFHKDADSPYIEEKPFTWIRGGRVGGRSLLWGRQCYRWGAMDFEANEKEGIGTPWPIGYDDLAPWYDYVESFVGISGQAEGVAACPDGQFLPPMAMNRVERVVKEGIERAFPERVMTIGRCAVLTQPHNGRAACHYCGPCQRGCSPGAYFSSLSATLPAAEATGNLTLRANSVVHSVIYDEEADRATGVRVIDAETLEPAEFYGRLIFLCASTLGSTHILLHSTSPRFPDGLANSSGALGHYLMDHHFQLGARGTMEGHEDRYYVGNRPNGIYIPRFRNVSRQTEQPDFVRGYGYQGSAGRPSWWRPLRGFGADFKHALRQPGPWEMTLTAFGEMLPRYENQVSLDPDRTDKYGIPLLRIACDFGDNEFAMRQDMVQQAVDMLEAAGCTDVRPYDNFSEDGYGAEPGLGIHEMGTARMGRDPRESVLNGYNQAHDVPNLFVTDGACMASSACQNPSITYMALTARAADFAVRELNRRNL
ncbi:MAG: GMC family oxidoreductase [Rhodothermales bacterium]|nr:GMC family oxidoreductase [Rhodothermales bacterium]